MPTQDETSPHTSPEQNSDPSITTEEIDLRRFASLDYIKQLRERGLDGGPQVSTLEPLPNPQVGVDGMMKWLERNVGSLGSTMRRASANHTAPLSTAIAPPFLRASMQSEQATWSPPWEETITFMETLTKLTSGLFDQLDRAASKDAPSPLGQAQPVATGASKSASSSSTGPVPSPGSLGLPFSSSLPPNDIMADSYRCDQQTLAKMIVELEKIIQAAPVDSVNHMFAMSSSGLMSLHLYELTRRDIFLEEGISRATDAFFNAFNLDQDGAEKSPALARRMPVFLRAFVYAARMKAQRDNAYEDLDVFIDLTMELLDSYKANIEYFSERAIMFLQFELADCLLARYRATGQSDSLDQSIRLLEEYVENPFPSICSVIGNAYLERFRLRGRMTDFDKCNSYAEIGSAGLDIVGSRPPTIFEIQCAHLRCLASHERYHQQEQAEYLHDAVTHGRRALEHLPQTHFLLPVYKSDLASCLGSLFLAEGSAEHLSSAVEEIEVAVALLPQIHLSIMPPKVTYGVVLSLRGSHKKGVEDLNRSIQMLSRARKDFAGRLHLESHMEYHLSQALEFRYHLANDEEDLTTAMDHARNSVRKADPSSPRRGHFMFHLLRLLFTKYRINPVERETYLSSARDLVRDLLDSSATPLTRLQAALELADLEEERSDFNNTFQALKAGLSVLPELAWAGHKMSKRYEAIVSRANGLSRRAALCAIKLNDLSSAVQVLEDGRNIIWSQALRPHGSQHGSNRHTANETEHLTQLLSKYAHDYTSVPVSEFLGGNTQLPAGLLDPFSKLLELRQNLKTWAKSYFPADSEYRHSLVRKLDRPLRGMDINKTSTTWLHSAAERLDELDSNTPRPHKTEGLLNLEKNPELSSILERGDIVLLNVTETQCSAIVLSTNDSSISLDHVNLSDLSTEDADEFGHTIRVGMYEMYTDSITPAEFEEAFLKPVLRELWNRIVQPVLKRLTPSQSTRRIWWYPTGPLVFLPIHAAGPYPDDEDVDGLPEIAISSYISSIKSLLRAQSTPTAPFKMLSIGQPNTPGQEALPAVDCELKFIRRACQAKPESLTTIVGQEGTVHAVKEAIAKHTWIHFSGHAVQDEEYPFESALFLHDGGLRLARLMQLDLSKIQFVYLSACMTSQGDQATPDESIHLAAGMQFGGARSTIATLWSVDDAAAALATREIYKHLFRNGVEKADPEDAAEALHLAIKNMKNCGISLAARVPFIHTGL